MKKAKTKTKTRHGFTMVELLFVMVIIGILAAIAIPNFGGGKKSAVITSMRSDARNAIATIQNFEVEEGENANYSELSGSYEDQDGDGYSDEDAPVKFSLSKKNKLYVNLYQCEDGTTGYKLRVTNPDVDKEVTYFSCENGKIQTVDAE